jgi:regulatory protein
VNELRRRAIGLLARREHSRAELARKLAANGTQEEIDTVLAQLEIEGLLSDARYAEAYVRSHCERFGAARLRQTLRTKGISSELSDAQVATLPDELERARAVWARKFAAAPGSTGEWARQARFLQGRGFAVDVIRRLLKEPVE